MASFAELPIVNAATDRSGAAPARGRLDLAAIRQRLDQQQGKKYWRSLEELAETETFQEFVHREFPDRATEWTDPVTRRQFLVLMGAALGLAGVTGCTSRPRETILPYIRQPEMIVPGRPLFFATAMTLGGLATGILVESHMGRPIKIEGNPDHPASLGATDVFAQAAVLSLYDPDRSKIVRYKGRPSTWTRALQTLRSVWEQQRTGKGNGAGLHILTETVTSPTLGHQLTTLLEALPEARWHQYEPGTPDGPRAGARLAFGADEGKQFHDVQTIYRVGRADVVVSLDADFLSCGPAPLRYVHDFMRRRRVRDEAAATMNRLYVIESTPSSTGMVADHRLPLRAHRIKAFARGLAHALARQLRESDDASADETALGILNQHGQDEFRDEGVPPQWLAALVRDLTAKGRRGKTLIVAGDHQPAVVHALAHVMNHALGNVGETVLYVDSVEARPVNQLESLQQLVKDMADGRVGTLLILGGNPIYTAPADIKLAALMEKVPLRLRLGLYEDETSQYCHWHIAETHFLESWGDARAFDGTVTIQQPLIAPLYSGTHSTHEVLAAFSERPDRSSHDIVKDYWRNQGRPSDVSGDFEQFWRRCLHDGVVAGTALPPRAMTLRSKWPEAPENGSNSQRQGTEIIFRLDPTIYDGRFANNAWLQELPKPLTKLTWDNAVLMSARTAERLNLSQAVVGVHGGEHGEAYVDMVELQLPGREPVQAPIWIAPGHPDESITVFLGYGRTRSGKVGTGTGFDAYRLRTAAAPWFEVGVEIRPRGRQDALACTQQHQLMNGRDLIRAGTLAQYEEDPHFAEHPHGHHEMPVADHGQPPYQLFPPHEYKGYKWGMVIDLSACVGCQACVVACQAENNIPVVGKSEVLRGREMHWLRIDRYNEGDLSHVASYFQPVPCMQCETAPCELVCPVVATAHSSEGLNDMVYNRCVGTRYCSNNCPYKVRRFNFLQYSDYATESIKLLHNPDVTVRSRGVMEKCTYCVQRINHARIETEKERRRIRDGEVMTACQAACPAEAIVFGDLNDPASQVARLHKSPLNYALLNELNTRPRTTYLAAVRNPNPDPDLKVTS